MAAGASAENDAVILNSAVIPVGLDARHVGLERNYMLETAFGQQAPLAPYAFTGGGRAATPLSPVHLHARRLATGDIAFSWIRRSRIDADDWAASEIPLDESEEEYQLEIIVGGAVVRVSVITAPTWLYTASDQITDFGTLADTFSVRLFQLGRKVPSGIPLDAEISLPT